MASTLEIAGGIDAWLRVREIPDAPGAWNGLQLENAGTVGKVACAVDACESVIRRAIAEEADLLVVHHGLFWSPDRMLAGAAYRKIKAAMDAGLAVYSCHIPLDVHPELGNNQGLARAIGLERIEPFFPWKGIHLGLAGTLDISRDALRARLARELGAEPHVCPAGPERAGRTGIITGGAGSEIHSLAGLGIDTFITGEGPHWSYTAAEELGINVFYAGHYATETFGVKALARRISETWGLPHVFLDHPTGM